MKTHPIQVSRSRWRPWRKARAGFWRNQAGSYTIIFALASPALIGFAALASEGGLWLYQHQTLQSAADSAALSAATLYGDNNGASLDPQADAVVASYGYTAGINGTTVTVHRPPTSGNYISNTQAVEVDITISQPRLLSSIFSDKPVAISGRAVALASGGTGCVLSLDSSASGGTSTQGSSSIALNGCSVYDDSANSTGLVNGGSASISAYSVNVVGGISGGAGITTTNGVSQGVSPVADPYAGVHPPPYSGCDHNNLSEKGTVTLDPGVYCNGLQLNAGANVTLKDCMGYV